MNRDLTSLMREFNERAQHERAPMPLAVHGLISVREPVETPAPIQWMPMSDGEGLQKRFTLDDVPSILMFAEMVLEDAHAAVTHAIIELDPPHVTVTIRCNEPRGPSERDWYFTSQVDLMYVDANGAS